MTPESVMMMGTEAMKVAIAVAAPLLLVALVTGLIISILQAATQINEMTLSFIPKIIAPLRGDYRCRALDAQFAAGLHAQPVHQSALHHRLTDDAAIHQRSVCSVARDLFLADAAHHGADLHRPHTQ